MADPKYTQGEYVTSHNHGALDMDVAKASVVLGNAKEIAAEKKVKPGKKMTDRGYHVITFSQEIWGEAYKQYDDEA